jgi:GNAT superfamily N-acetyltransferase
MIETIEIKDADEKSEITGRILRELPHWFELESAVAEYVDGVKDKPFFAAKLGDKVVGFVSVEDHNEHSSEIYVMGVLPENRGGGVGGKLVERIWNRNVELGKKFLFVKTLDEPAKDKFYEETRQFYLKMGFLPLFSTTEIWDENNPCLVMLKIK